MHVFPRLGECPFFVLRQGRFSQERDITLGSDVLIMAISMNPFSADSKLLVLPAGIDEDGDGVWTQRLGRTPDGRMAKQGEKLQPAVYDIASGKLTRIGVKGLRMAATFDRTGKHVIAVAIESMRPLVGKM